ncbi:MAG: M15 family metallopeptidase [Oscillospiraceae bacterium]|nr:M15 family metallopeptidase [Oscillospiraceae bacterium]
MIELRKKTTFAFAIIIIAVFSLSSCFDDLSPNETVVQKTIIIPETTRPVTTVTEQTTVTELEPETTEPETTEPETEATEPEPEPEPLPIIDNEWALWLISANHPLPLDYVPQLVEISGSKHKIDIRVKGYADLLFEAAQRDGINLRVISGYRSVEDQEMYFLSVYRYMKSKGYSDETAFYKTIAEIAVPYTSEHNAGLAIDFNLIEEHFDQTPEFRWLAGNAWKYGFIMRYPADKTNTTGIIYEPWHFRFVGLYHAEQIYNSGLCLEEYIDALNISIGNSDYQIVEEYKNYVLSL